MSWTAEEWKVGLPSRALQKISEQERQLEQLSKEKQQKQLQLEALETSLHKQKQKLDEGRAELAAVTHEKQSLAELNTGTERVRQRLVQELQVKDAQVCSLQGQLSAAKKEISSLEQELKRCRAELEKLQGSGKLGESHLFPTPPWSSNGSPLPAGQDTNVTSPSRLTERAIGMGHTREVVGSPASPYIQQQLQFSRSNSPMGNLYRRDSPGFPWQEEPYHERHSVTPKRGHLASQIPWGQEDLPPPSVTKPPAQNWDTNCEKVHQKRKEMSGDEVLLRDNEELRCTVAQLQSNIQAQQKEDQILSVRCRDLQMHLDKTKSLLAVEVKKTNKGQEELQRQAVKQEQTELKSTALEQKLRHLTEELKCQRQNSETTKRNLEQMIRQKEKEHQQEVATHQQQCLALEHHHLQECTRLRQELQQAKTDGQALQAEMGKLRAQHQSGERELEKLKGEVRQAEQENHTCQRKIEQLYAELETTKGRESAPSTGGPPYEIWAAQEDEMRQPLAKRSHTAVGLRAHHITGAGKTNQETSKVATSTSRENINPCKVSTFQSEAGNLTSAIDEAEDCLAGREGPTVHSESDASFSQGANRDCDVSQPVSKQQCFEVCHGEIEALSTELVSLPDSSQNDKEVCAGALSDPEGVHDLREQDNRDVCREEGQPIQSELLEMRLKLHEASTESELRRKGLFEARFKLKQATKKYEVETSRLKKQVLELTEKLLGLQEDLGSERLRTAECQQESQAQQDECRRLSALLESKKTDTQFHEVEVKHMQSDMVELVKIKLDEEGTQNTKTAETLEEVGGLECKANEEGEHCGSAGLDLHIMRERLHTLEEQLKGALDHNRLLQDEIKKGEHEQTLAHNLEQPDPNEMEEKVKVLQAQCEMFAIQKLEADTRATLIQEKLNCLQATINMQTQQLTLAFEAQTQNIDDLLLSLQEKESSITTLNEELERYTQSLALLQAENALLLTAKIQPAEVENVSSVSATDASHSATLEYAVLSTRQTILESCPWEKGEDSSMKHPEHSKTDVGLGRPQHAHTGDDQKEGGILAQEEITRQSISDVCSHDEMHPHHQMLRGLKDHLDYAITCHRNQERDGGDKLTSAPSQAEDCLLQDLTENPKPCHQADSFAGVSPIDNVLVDLSTVAMVTPLQKNVCPSQDAAEQETKISHPKLLEKCLHVEHEPILLDRKLLDLQSSLTTQEARDVSSEQWSNTRMIQWQNGPGDTEAQKNDLVEVHRQKASLEIQEDKATVLNDSIEEQHWRVLLHQCQSLQVAVTGARLCMETGSKTLAYTVLQQQVDIIHKMLSDLLEEKPPQEMCLDVCNWGETGDQTPSHNLSRVDGEALVLKNDLLGRGDSVKILHSIQNRATKFTQTGIDVMDTIGEPCGDKCRAWQREEKLWERGDTETASMDVCQVDSKVLVKKAWLLEIDNISRFKDGYEEGCRPLTEVAETWARGDNERRAATQIHCQVPGATERNGEIPHKQKEVLGGETVYTQRIGSGEEQAALGITHDLRPEPARLQCTLEITDNQNQGPRGSYENGENKYTQRSGTGETQVVTTTTDIHKQRQGGKRTHIQRHEPGTGQLLEETTKTQSWEPRRMPGRPETKPASETTCTQYRVLEEMQVAIATVHEGQGCRGIHRETETCESLPETLSELKPQESWPETVSKNGTEGLGTLSQREISGLQLQENIQEKGLASPSPVEESIKLRDTPSDPWVQMNILEMERQSVPLVPEALPKMERLLDPEVYKTMPMDGSHLEREELPESKRHHEPQLQKRLQEMKVQSEPTVHEIVSEKEESFETLVLKRVPDRETPSESHVLERLHEREQLSETQALNAVRERKIQSELQVMQRLPESGSPSGWQQQEIQIGSKIQSETLVQEQLSKKERQSEYCVQDRLVEAKMQSEYFTNDCALETVSPSDRPLKEKVPKYERPSETLVLEALPETEVQCATKGKETLPEVEGPADEEVAVLREEHREMNLAGINASSVAEPRTHELGRTLAKEPLLSYKNMDNELQSDAKRVPKSKLRLDSEGPTLLSSGHRDPVEKQIKCNPEGNEAPISRAVTQYLASPSLGSEEHHPPYTELLSSYQALEEANCILSQTVAGLREELEELRGAARPEVCHSNTQTDLLGGTVSMEGQDSPAWILRESPEDLAKRLQRQRDKMSVAYDETEYEPYGLPEVVMKGFADIPSGPACPYVLRRGLLGSSLLAAPKQSPDHGASASLEGSSV
ncbi:early endosome antigen 1-like [Ambystoma mexicanum]|uniref:early endosome antigen 1-like n=1 Tax=Ambystoma mexicanum TaxID=8296 RepID=UPI0037E85BC9